MERNQSIEKWCNVIQSLNDDGMKCLETLFPRLFEGSDRFTTKDPDKLAHYREYEAKVAAERDAKIERAEKEKEEFLKVFCYERNPTMRLLGHQSTWSIFAGSPDAMRMVNDVLDAYKYESFIEESMAIDLFTLGVICGKRMERQRKEGRA